MFRLFYVVIFVPVGLDCISYVAKRVSTLKVASSTSLLSANRHHGKQEQTPEVVKHVELAKEKQEKRVALQFISQCMLKLLGLACPTKPKSPKA